VRRRLTLTADIAPLAGLERLNAPDRPPIAVALSGGGDSLALLHLAKAWADREGRTLIALTVDHGLQPASAGWSRFCAERAARLGIAHRTLAWIGDKPTTGVPAAARAARHALLAEAARAAGARVILMAHTADDLMEAELMRAAGASAPSPRLWSPSPAWPAGRGVFLLRPLLQRRRAELRALLEALGETWIEDPANDDPRYARTLARRRLSQCSVGVATVGEAPAPPSVLSHVRQGLGGEFAVPRDLLSAVAPDERRRLFGALALCAAGTTRPPSAAALDRLVAKLSEPAFTTTLAGARFQADATELLVCREAGEAARGGLEPFDLPLGESVFDGRFVLTAHQPGYRVVPLAGHAAKLSRAERARLGGFHATVRPGLPAIVSPSGGVTCPLLAPDDAIRAEPLGLARLRGALGAIVDEASVACG
jgi:tRNA(Ile)-lysidine synthase